MARRKLDAQDVDVRAALAAHLQKLIADYAPLSSDPSCPWPRRLAALESGSPLEVHGWQLPRSIGRHPNARYVLNDTGTLIEVAQPRKVKQ